MSQPLLQINFTLGVPPADYAQMCAGLAETFAAIPGLRWKTWILNEQRNEAGGIYLFESDAALQDYLNSPLAAQVKSHPALLNVSAKVFSVMEDVSTITRAPIGVAV
jgi:hypothetical protein